MGNRALITIEDEKKTKHPVALYLHWNGGLECVLAFMEYTHTLFTNSSDIYDYHTRLCQVLRNFFDDGYSLYANPIRDIGKSISCDNGLFHFRIGDKVELIAHDHNGYRETDKQVLEEKVKRARDHRYWTESPNILDAIKEKMPHEPQKWTLYALVVDNDGGTSVSLHRNEELARKAVFNYASEFWHQVLPEADTLDQYSEDEAIARYFDHSDDRYFIDVPEIEL